MFREDVRRLASVLEVERRVGWSWLKCSGVAQNADSFVYRIIRLAPIPQGKAVTCSVVALYSQTGTGEFDPLFDDVCASGNLAHYSTRFCGQKIRHGNLCMFRCFF